MMERRFTGSATAGLALLLLLLGACARNDDDAPAAPVDEVPASATASTRAWVDTIGQLPSSEAAEPLGLKNVATPPTSETEEPFPLT